MEIDGLVQQVLSGLDSTHPVKPEPVSDLDATNKSLEEILTAISTPPPETPAPQESVLDKLIEELKNSATPSSLSEDPKKKNPIEENNPFGVTEDWGEERY